MGARAAGTGRWPGRTVRVPGLGTAALATMLLLVSFAVPALVAVKSLARLATVRDYAERSEVLARVQGRLQSRIIDGASQSLLANALIVDAMRASLAELAASGLADEGQGQRLAELRTVVARRNVLPPDVLLEGIVLMQGLAEREAARQRELLEELRLDPTREIRLAALGFLTVGALATWFLWVRVLRPLRGLESFLTRLSEGDFEAAPTGDLHPVMQPVFEHYNDLVGRLAVLETEHRERAHSLEEAVRSASVALLEQHQALARSERLAAVGETAAGVAHDLRNPLAGASTALDNLRQEITEPDLAARLQVVAGEVDRAVRTLNEYLRSARHAPEESVVVDVGELVRDVAEVLRYQSPPNVTIEIDAEPDLTVLLPRERIRQALTNLILNSLQAMAGSTGRVLVSVRRSGDQLELTVEDEGPGFPKIVLESKGRPFATSREGGTGLGLAISRRAAQDLGGAFELYNRTPAGAGVRMSVPLNGA